MTGNAKNYSALSLSDIFQSVDFGSDLRNEWADAAAKELRRLHEANAELLEALGKYADLDNWNKDQSGVDRVWLEPDSSTRAAYSGYYSARLAITKAVKSATGETE